MLIIGGLTVLSVSLPVIIVDLLWIVVGIVPMKQDATFGWLVVIGFAVLLVQIVVFTPINVILPTWVTGSGRSYSTLAIIFAVLGLIRSLIVAHCAAQRWSFHIMQGRSTLPSASSSTKPCI